MPPEVVIYRPPIPEVGYYTERDGRKSTVLMFPGQGTQLPGMGRELCKDENPEVQALYKEAEEVFGRSLLDLTEADLNKTLWAQPAIFVHSEAKRLVLKKHNPVSSPYYIGNSLGLYNALYAAGAFYSFKDALRLIKARAESMQKACDLTETGLCAFFIPTKDGQELSEKQKEAFAECGKHLTDNNIGLYLEADINESQIVFGGKKTDLREAKLWFEDWLKDWAQKRGYEDIEQARKELGFVFADINVSGAFHSPYMTVNRADRDFKIQLMNTKFRKTKVPVIANTTAMPIQTPEEIKNELYDHLDLPVLLRQSFDYLEAQGVKILMDVSEKGVMARIARSRGQIDYKTIDLRRDVSTTDVAIGAGAAAAVAAVLTFAVVRLRKKWH